MIKSENWIKIELPLPPSVNEFNKITKDGRFYKSTKARDWEDEAGYMLLSAPKWGDARVKVHYYFYFKTDASDYGNRAKILDDLLQKMNIINNDKQIMEAHIYKNIDSNNQRVQVEIYKI